MQMQTSAGPSRLAVGHRSSRLLQLPNVTVAIITYNEAENLTELLPMLDWAAEVIVIDSGSTDRTIEIARGAWSSTTAADRLTALRCNVTLPSTRSKRIGFFRSMPMSGPLRGLVEAMARAVRRSDAGSRRPVAYHVPIRSHIFGKPVRRGGTQDDRPIRFFRRDRARWSGKVHEVLEVTGPISQLDGWLTHRTQHDLHTFLTKMNRYTTLDAQARVRVRRSSSPFRPTLGSTARSFPASDLQARNLGRSSRLGVLFFKRPLRIRLGR